MKTDPEDFKMQWGNHHRKPEEPKHDQKKFTSQEAIDMATKAVAGLGEYYQDQIDRAEARGYQKAIDEMRVKLDTLFFPIIHKNK